MSTRRFGRYRSFRPTIWYTHDTRTRDGTGLGAEVLNRRARQTPAKGILAENRAVARGFAPRVCSLVRYG